ncbi:MAG: SRPBCC domain-containing protein [Thaumarchaeota archaeon]|nr:SRPBCC domain-containing protein [Nitrososphaerota archaeon]
MHQGFVAKASISINAPVAKVWNALVNPEVIKQYMFGTEVVSEWTEGSPIVWRGTWEGKRYEDRGVILKLEPERVLQYSHFSPLSGLPDTPENYHTVALQLTAGGNQTLVSLSQDNNPTEESREHSQKNWGMMLASMKKTLEEKKY